MVLCDPTGGAQRRCAFAPELRLAATPRADASYRSLPLRKCWATRLVAFFAPHSGPSLCGKRFSASTTRLCEQAPGSRSGTALRSWPWCALDAGGLRIVAIIASAGYRPARAKRLTAVAAIPDDGGSHLPPALEAFCFCRLRNSFTGAANNLWDCRLTRARLLDCPAPTWADSFGSGTRREPAQRRSCRPSLRETRVRTGTVRAVSALRVSSAPPLFGLRMPAAIAAMQILQ